MECYFRFCFRLREGWEDFFGCFRRLVPVGFGVLILGALLRVEEIVVYSFDESDLGDCIFCTCCKCRI